VYSLVKILVHCGYRCKGLFVDWSYNDRIWKYQRTASASFGIFGIIGVDERTRLYALFAPFALFVSDRMISLPIGDTG